MVLRSKRTVRVPVGERQRKYRRIDDNSVNRGLLVSTVSTLLDAVTPVSVYKYHTGYAHRFDTYYHTTSMICLANFVGHDRSLSLCPKMF